MKILAIGAHPDDIEIFMYGILSICKKRGDQIFLAVATDGALGLPKKNKSNYNRSNETTLGLKKIGKPILMNIPDGSLGIDFNDYNKFKLMIENIKPDLIITHYKSDYHSDHRALYKIVKHSSGHYTPILFCDTMMGLNFNPNYYVDITSEFNLKIKAILKHKSQAPERFVNLAKLMNSYRAAQCNAPIGKFAEAYKFNKNFPFSDIRSLLPKSLNILPFDIKNQRGFL